ncbi:hypothetical protein BB558_004877 [Smittium angustum]|uniref:Uncharacterized protein n=1 Tax=Smittium angustum TaxID=133377 RepID=A0A2U1J213_SMIAN|nr:hypothetical protein BB558_004877 [Smittium angustum]
MFLAKISYISLGYGLLVYLSLQLPKSKLYTRIMFVALISNISGCIQISVFSGFYLKTLDQTPEKIFYVIDTALTVIANRGQISDIREKGLQTFKELKNKNGYMKSII